MAEVVYQPGDRVAWSHVEATKHASASVVRWSAVQAADKDARLGTIIRAENEAATQYLVALDEPWVRERPHPSGEAVDGYGTLSDSQIVLTADEIVRVEEGQ